MSKIGNHWHTVSTNGMVHPVIPYAIIWTKVSGKLNLTPSDIERTTDDRVFSDFKEASQIIHSLGGIITVHAGSKSNSIENIKSNLEKFKDAIKEELIIDYIDILEISKAENINDYINIVFPAIGIELPLILASDNHNASEYENSRFVWIKADPTFEGLKQIVNEPQGRVFIGEEPELLKRVRDNKTKYIKSLSIKKNEGSSLDEVWFDENPDVEINSGLTAVIGNKGSGKSAIADTLGLIGNTPQSEHFSFLNQDKFKKKKNNKAKHFTATLSWESGDGSTKLLDDDIDSNSVETIKCIPQNYLERICTDQLEGSLFNEELKAVIFSHVKEAERLNCLTLDELISKKTKEKDESIEIIRDEIGIINETIASLEAKLHPDYRQKIQNLLENKNKEKAAHENIKPAEVKAPEADEQQEKVNQEITNKPGFPK